ncbi:hypothetical protein KY284_007945 [Solanum tuberosum]|nr:hypothetical protein KY284_007945 [Solanum tuberosum]
MMMALWRELGIKNLFEESDVVLEEMIETLGIRNAKPEDLVKYKTWKFKLDLSLRNKEEVTQQIQAKVVEVTKHPTWLANIVLMPKRNAVVSQNHPNGYLKGKARIERVWSHWKKLGEPKLIMVPMVDNSKLPFRHLCRHIDDVDSCLEEIGADGVLSAYPLLDNPTLFAGSRTAEWGLGVARLKEDDNLDQAELLIEYLRFCERYPVPWRIIHSHVHKLLGEWFSIQPSMREDLNKQYKLTFEFLYDLVNRLKELGMEPSMVNHQVNFLTLAHS